LDSDGGVDVVLTRLNESPVLLRNVMKKGNWIAFQLKGGISNRDGIGARVRIKAGNGAQWNQQWNHMTSAVGYVSSSHAPVHFGLGTVNKLEEVEIRWPSGAVQRLNAADVKVNAVNRINEPKPDRSRE
jgi:hypothetical protein